MVPIGYEQNMLAIILAIILGTLAAIVYSLRVLVLVERRIERIEFHIERAVAKVLQEEVSIDKKLSAKRKK